MFKLIDEKNAIVDYFQNNFNSKIPSDLYLEVLSDSMDRVDDFMLISINHLYADPTIREGGQLGTANWGYTPTFEILIEKVVTPSTIATICDSYFQAILECVETMYTPTNGSSYYLGFTPVNVTLNIQKYMLSGNDTAVSMNTVDRLIIVATIKYTNKQMLEENL